MATTVLNFYAKKKSGEILTRQISWWEAVIDHPNRMKRQRKYSISIRNQYLYFLLGEVSDSLALALWRTLAHQISAGNIIQ